MRGWGFFLLLLLLVIIAYGGWVAWVYLKARREGVQSPHWRSYIPFASAPGYRSSYPSPRRGGLVGWLKDRISAFRNRSTARGRYEEHLESGLTTRGDVDEPWDAGMGHDSEPYDAFGSYEEQALGRNQPYGGDRYGPARSGLTAANEEHLHRNDTRQYDGESAILSEPVSTESRNPFGDDAEHSDLRNVEPQPLTDALRPEDETHGTKNVEDSSTERRSMFRESL